MGRVHGTDSGAARMERGPAAEMKWLVDDALSPGAGLSVARMTLKPGRTSERHRHPNCSEVIHLIAGSVEQSVDGASFLMAPGDTVFVPPGSAHHSRNLGVGEAVMIVCYSAGSRIYDPAEDG